MAYSGTLAQQPGTTGVRTEIELAPDRVTLQQGDQRSEWTWEQVRIVSWDTTTARLQLPTGELYYRADDPLSFSEAVRQTEVEPDQRTSRTGRWWDAVFGDPAPPQPPPKTNAQLTVDEPVVESLRPEQEPLGDLPPLSDRIDSIDLSDPSVVAPAETEPGGQEAGEAPATRRRRFRRRKAAHVHAWTEDQVTGGIVRRVCAECRLVSIDLRSADAPTV